MSPSVYTAAPVHDPWVTSYWASYCQHHAAKQLPAVPQVAVQPEPKTPTHSHAAKPAAPSYPTAKPDVTDDEAIAHALYQEEKEAFIREQAHQLHALQQRQLLREQELQVLREHFPQRLQKSPEPLAWPEVPVQPASHRRTSSGSPSPDYSSQGTPRPKYEHSNSEQELIVQRLDSQPSQQLSLSEGSHHQESSVDARATVLRRLKEYGFVEKPVKADGNCQFRSISDQMYGDPSHHQHVRQIVVGQMKANPSAYAPFVHNSSFKEYLSEMSKSGTWGDNVTLQAAADYFGLKIYVITSYKDRYVVVIEPSKRRSNRLLYLSFWAEAHYNSLYFSEDVDQQPKTPSPPKKVLGSRNLGKLGNIIKPCRQV